MGLFRGPELVTEGLFSAFDAAAPRSYTSGSSTWNDLSGHNNGSDVRASNEFSTDFNGGIAVVAQTGGVKMPGWDDRTVWTTGFVYTRTGNTTSYGRLLGSGGGTGGIDTGEVALFSTDGNLRFNGPRDSWTDSGITIALNSTTYIWEAPITYPTDGKNYYWKESLYQSDNTKGWYELGPGAI